MCQRLWEVDGWCGKLPFPAGNHMVAGIRVELFAGIRNVTNWPDLSVLKTSLFGVWAS